MLLRTPWETSTRTSAAACGRDVGHLERGIKKPSLRTIQGLAKVFAIKCGDLLDEPLPRQQPYPIEKKFTQSVRQSKRLVGK